MEFLDILKMMFIFLLPTIGTDTFILHKNFKPKNIKKVLLPPELIESDKEIDLGRFVSTDYMDILNNFLKTMIDNFEDEDLINFYNNISNVDIKILKNKLDKLKFHRNVKGVYSMNKNEIIVDSKFINLALSHELLHMAATCSYDNKFYSGFQQYDDNTGFEIGRGLNEGYTEVIRQRYFYTDDDIYYSTYSYELSVASLLEKIIGKDKMEKLYLNTNLPGIIKELEKYSTKEETIDFLTKLDFINKFLNRASYFLGTSRMIRKSMDSIILYLLKIYRAKIIAISSGQEEDTNNLICEDNFISDLPIMAINNFKSYEISNEVEMIRRNSHKEIDELRLKYN